MGDFSVASAGGCGSTTSEQTRPARELLVRQLQFERFGNAYGRDF